MLPAVEAEASAAGITRRRLLLGGASMAGLAVLAGAGCRPSYAAPGLLALPGERATDDYLSDPALDPPGIKAHGEPDRAVGSYVFVTQKRPIIVDVHGETVWERAKPSGKTSAANFRVQRYRGEPVLTWWEGLITHGFGSGEGVVLDRHYREIARVRAGNGFDADLHELLLTDRGTALITVYEMVPHDLTSVGGPADATLLDSGLQEIDLASGEVLFQWLARDHVDLAESYRQLEPPGSSTPWFDHFHVNGISVDADGDLLVSGRHTWAIYKISRNDGSVRWRLGGRRSDFRLDPDAVFAWQHHVTAQPDGSITLFDNRNGPHSTMGESRGIQLDVDLSRRAVTLRRECRHPEGFRASSQGSMQLLDDGRAFVGWGSVDRFSGFDGHGQLRFDGRLGEDDQSYRAFHQAWRGRPLDPPTVEAKRVAAGRVRLAMSWNGATDVRTWEILTGDDPNSMAPVGHVQPAGFETSCEVATSAPLLDVRAVDAAGTVLGTAAPVHV
jgi:hypothetical protein